ncbi:hypothetical protein MMC30_003674 [Trapelia coarctata]|nr:hypothetical protein [Trapelia coarctata]
MAPVTHVVLFKYRSDISWTDLEQYFRGFTALQTTFLNPNGKPYMLSMRMGKNISSEPFSKGMTHAFILEFASPETKTTISYRTPSSTPFPPKQHPSSKTRSLSISTTENSSRTPRPRRRRAIPGAATAGHRLDRHSHEPAAYPLPLRHVQEARRGTLLLQADCRHGRLAHHEGESRVYTYTGASEKPVLCFHCANCTSHVYHQ